MLRNGHHLGPFSLEEIQKSFDEDKLLDSDVVWKVGLKNWIPLTKLVPKKTKGQEIAVDIVPPPITKELKPKSNFLLKFLAFFPLLIIAVGFYFLYPQKAALRFPFLNLIPRFIKKSHNH